MTPEQRAEILKGAKEAFFAAMLDGYCGEKKKSQVIPANNGHTKIVRFVHGLYIVEDEWDTNPESNFSGGATRIFLTTGTEWFPVWRMSYQGLYPESAIPFLKRTLRKNYKKKIFLGGRGPKNVVTSIMLYQNSLRDDSPKLGFAEFAGEEKIYRRAERFSYECLGYHKYFGMALI